MTNVFTLWYNDPMVKGAGMKTSQLQIRVSEQEKRQLSAFAADMGISLSELVLESCRAAYAHRPEMRRVSKEHGSREAFMRLTLFTLENPL